MNRQFNRIHIVGDLHGHKHSLRNAWQAGWITNDDLVICLGDVGINYGTHSNRRGERKSFAKFPFQFLFIYGNHEQRPEEKLNYQLTQVEIGEVYMDAEFPNQWFAVDGAAYQLGIYSFLTVGGATSIDKHRREAYKSWWPTENIRAADIYKALDHDTSHFSFILTHTCPESLIPFADKYNNPDEKLLDVLREQLTWDYWFCGHWHINETVPEENFYFLNANLNSIDKLAFVTFDATTPKYHVLSDQNSLY